MIWSRWYILKFLVEQRPQLVSKYILVDYCRSNRVIYSTLRIANAAQRVSFENPEPHFDFVEGFSTFFFLIYTHAHTGLSINIYTDGYYYYFFKWQKKLTQIKDYNILIPPFGIA